MSVSLNDVIRAIEPEEPDYESAVELGADALEYLRQIAQQPDPMLASKATYLASLISDERAALVLETAAASEYPTVRLAAAAGVANLSPRDAPRIALGLLNDDDPGVRRCALESLPVTAAVELHGRLEAIGHDDPDVTIRLAASQALERAAVSY